MIDDVALALLVSSLPPEHGPILPNLLHLEWTSSSDDDIIPQVLTFISPSLQSLEVTAGGSPGDGDIGDVSRTLAEIANRTDIHLSRLVVGWEEADPVQFTAALIKLLGVQALITEFEIVRLESGGASPILAHLSQLPLLRRLAVEVWLDTELMLEDFLDQLTDACPKLVEALEIRIPHGMATSTPFRSLSPLLRAKGLKELRIGIEGEIVVEEHDIAAMGAAWPHMRSLAIHSSPESNPISTLPLYALHFSSVLESLDLNFTTKDRPLYNENTPTFDSLRTLLIGGELGRSMAADVASFLTWVCPKAEIKHSSPWMESNDAWGTSEEEWKDAMVIVKAGRRLQEVTIRRLEKGRSL